jgi:hypothetical protein
MESPYMRVPPLDMIEVKAARVPAGGITTGSHNPEQLKEAGAVEVLPPWNNYPAGSAPSPVEPADSAEKSQS